MAIAGGEVCVPHVVSRRWRVTKSLQALAFGYFESLLRSPNRNRIDQESARLRSLNNALTLAGFNKDMYMDFVCVTLDLLELLAERLPYHDGRQELLKHFNDEAQCSAIIQHFRVRKRREVPVAPCPANVRPAGNQRMDEVACGPIRVLPPQRDH